MSTIPEQLRKSIENILAIMDKEEISQTSDLNEKLMFVRNYLNGFVSLNDFVSITLRPSNMNTTAHTISYTVPGKEGILVEIKINPTLNYSEIILKTDDVIPGYNPFAIDPYNKIIQHKNFSSTNFSEVRNELESLLQY